MGGEHKDTVEDKSFVKGASKQTKVYDAIDGVTLDLGKEGKDKTSKQYFINQYDAKEFKYGNTTSWPLFSLDPDNGFALGAGLNFKKNGFKKLPYAQSHTISGLYSFGTNGSNIIYKGEYTAAIGSWDLVNEINLKGDKHTFNFFGFGNESVNDSEDEKRFNQIRQSLVGVNVSLRKKYRSGAAIKFTPLFEKIEIEETPNRYISLNSDVLPSYIFNNFLYVGAEFSFTYSSRNSTLYILPQGMDFSLKAGWKKEINDVTNDFSYFKSALTFNHSLNQTGSITWATKVSIHHNFTNFEFFQAAIIGGKNGLRGFRNERFNGKTAFYHSNDLRFHFSKYYNRIIPFDYGMYLSFDYGKVWIDSEVSNMLHTSYGTGVWLKAFETVVINAGIHFSDEKSRVVAGIGFEF